MRSKKVGLVILDGWGHGKKDGSNAIYCANTPFVDSLYGTFANAELRTDGEHVGLPDGQMGNSEVGHMNIGAGRIVYQDLLKIDLAVRNDELKSNANLIKFFKLSRSKNNTLHLIGLVSDGGVHSHQEHLFALIRIAKANGIEKIRIHAFTDGRDTDPKSGINSLAKLQKVADETGAKIASVSGRYYAMDRDLRWERIQKAYNAMVNGSGASALNAKSAVEDAYANQITDEFIEPTWIADEEGKALGLIKDGDSVLCFNFRTDRCREITRALVQESFEDFGMKKLDLSYATMTNYDASFKGVDVIFDKENLKDTLGEVLSKHGKHQLRLAETEKYPHVTFFFNGGEEVAFEGEERSMASSPKVATYDLQPEMSAEELVKKLENSLETEEIDFFCLNFANPDMVGHTGVFQAIMKAVETTDTCLQEVVQCAEDHEFSLVVIADHGNADKAVNEDGSPNTAHSTNPVPIFIIDQDVKVVRSGVLADVAPTILKLMNLPQPSAMTGSSLID